MCDLERRWSEVQAGLARACERSGRAVESVRIMGVTKTQPPEVVDAAVRLGLTLFGENKVQEARAKVPLVSSSAQWHFIGHLQSNKARDAVALFSCVESVDSAALAAELDRQCERQGRHVDVMLEVNVSGEKSKFGVAPDAAASVLESVLACPRLRAVGLMTLAPWSEDPEKARPCFALLRDTRDRLERGLGVTLPELSMGMSGDYVQAVAEGSTLVRIGTALFGPRRSLLSRRAEPGGGDDL